MQLIQTINIELQLTSVISLAIERVLEKNVLNMEIIVNSKTFANGLNVIQLETAVGAAMKSFEGSIGKFKDDRL